MNFIKVRFLLLNPNRKHHILFLSSLGAKQIIISTVYKFPDKEIGVKLFHGVQTEFFQFPIFFDSYGCKNSIFRTAKCLGSLCFFYIKIFIMVGKENMQIITDR